MNAPEPEQTPFEAVSVHTSRIQRVGGIRRNLYKTTLTLLQQYQALLDQSTPFVLYRWIATGVCLLLFFVRILVAQGWYIGTHPSKRLFALDTS